jgi:hypothetical protein
VNETYRKSVLVYEIAGMLFIIMLGSLLHFTFEWSGKQPVVGILSAVNESVWEHLKLAFWPTILFMLIGCYALKRKATNLFLGKTIGVCLMIVFIPIVFYAYTAITGKSIFMIDIFTFVAAVIIGQLASYKLLTFRKLSEEFDRIAIIVLLLLAIMFILFTFYPLPLPFLRDPNTGKYGIP